MAATLEATSLSRRFGTVTALDDLNLSIGPGEVVCLLGANGAGKTTTLNLFLGFLRPSAGTVRVAGWDPVSQAASARAVLGYVPETVALYPRLSGMENLAFFNDLNGEARAAREALPRALDRVGLSADDATRRAETYSKGMRQKVGLAVALLKNARALLLDEPLSGLDPDAANQFQQLVRDAAAGGAAVLMATHDLFRAREIATRIAIMRSGRLIELLDAADVSLADLEALYLRHMRAAP